MADYVQALKNDLVEQFKGKPHIEALMEVIGEQLQEVAIFYEQLRTKRNVYTSVGKQLDGVGDIAVMTRKEAGQLAGNPIPFDVLDDETYRLYLMYKIMKNNCDCTYPFILKVFRMFWELPLYYSEDPEQPATMIFDTGVMPGTVDTDPLFRVPLLRAAGVTLKMYIRTETTLPFKETYIGGDFCGSIMNTRLPDIDFERAYREELFVAGAGHGSLEITTLPELAGPNEMTAGLVVGAHTNSITQTTIPETGQKEE